MRGSLPASPSVPTEGQVSAYSRPHPFAVGDRVRCIRGGSVAGWVSKLRVGDEYVVVEVSDNGWMQGVNLDDPRLPPGVPHYSVGRFAPAVSQAQSGNEAAEPRSLPKNPNPERETG